MCNISKTSIVFHNTIVVRLLQYDSSHSALSHFLLVIRLVSYTVFLCYHAYLHSMEMSIGVYNFKNFLVHGLGNQHSITFLC